MSSISFSILNPKILLFTPLEPYSVRMGIVIVDNFFINIGIVSAEVRIDASLIFLSMYQLLLEFYFFINRKRTKK